MKLTWQNIKKSLENFLQCKWYRLTGKLTYPSAILPRVQYVHILNLSDLSQRQEIYVLRRSNKNMEETYNNLGAIYTLREDAIDPIEVPNMSLNLMCGKFLEDHLRFIPEGKSDATKNWDGVSEIYLSDFLNSYKIIDDYCPIYFDVRGISDQFFLYDKDKSPELTREMENFYTATLKKKYIGKPKEGFIGDLFFVHVPTNLNYWHSELKLQDYRKDLIDRKKAKWIERLADDVIRNILCVNGYKNMPATLSPIPTGYYTKPLPK